MKLPLLFLLICNHHDPQPPPQQAKQKANTINKIVKPVKTKKSPALLYPSFVII
ncbi:MAG TPA: hypothetical protein VM935_19290 [Chitinophagaceae bacterium]|nr:hypothetical protein [Chitinophagaceae bacterium]